jgi:hypothetical protein
LQEVVILRRGLDLVEPRERPIVDRLLGPSGIFDALSSSTITAQSLV